MNTTLNTDVLIIGGGPAGMTSAINLERLGISSIVVERQATISEHPKAHELSARSIEILLQLGFTLEELREEASPHADASRIVFAHTLRQELGHIDLLEEGNDAKYKAHLASPEPYLNLSQTELERIMRSRLRTCEHSQLLLEHQWESMTETSDGMESVVKDSRQGENLLIKSSYVICADGAGSRSRKALGIPMLGDDKLDDFVSVYFELNLRNYVRSNAKLYWIFNPEAPGTFIAHHIEKRWVYHFPIYMPYEKREDYSSDVLRHRILTALGDHSIPLQIKSISYWRMTCQTAKTFRKGRAFLVGDAAHRFPPTGGLGMNSGIGDVQNLCWKLAFVIQGIASQKLLDSYETERRPVVELNSRESLNNYRKIFEVPQVLGLNPAAMIWKARLVNSWIFKMLPSPWTKGILQNIYRKLSKKIMSVHEKPALNKKFLRAINNQIEHFDRIGLDLGYVYNAGAVVQTEANHPPLQTISHYQPSIEVGVRFPHFWVFQNGMQKSSHDWLTPDSFTLLCNEEGMNWWSKQKSRLREAVQSVICPIHVEPFLQNRSGDPSGKASFQYPDIPLVMVRPDGQVAWKSSSVAIDANAIFTQILPTP